MTAAQPFDLTGDLPGAVTMLEASAGTGKTYTIEGLVTRYVADGIPLPRLLVVTFTRAATAELRERVRTRLLRTAEALTAGPSDDPVVEVLQRGGDGDVARRHELLRTAIAEFDAATIATIHGFCQHVLGGLGLAGDADRRAALLEDERQIVDAVVADVYVRRFAGHDTHPEVTWRQLAAIARAVVANPDACIVPVGADDEVSALRADLARQVRREVALRKRSLGVLSFDDVLGRLAATLDDPVAGSEAKRRLGQQYRVALIDEFQDTDPVQWRIVERAFGDLPLVLIGDPKQAIYAFRGADVHAYLAAAAHASQHATLETNWRSDGPLLDALNALFDAAQFGPGIEHRPVRPAEAHADSRVRGGDIGAPLRLRWLPRHKGLPPKFKGLLIEPAREHVTRDLAAQVVALLDAGASIPVEQPDGSTAQQPIGPPHIAVLVRRNIDAGRVQRHLRDAGIPAVINGVGSVFETEAAGEWQRLLAALERPSSPSRLRTLALTCFFGWSAHQVESADDEAWDRLHARAHALAGLLRDRSVAALVQSLTAEQGLARRLLGVAGGERLLTDVLHIGELLHTASTDDALGPTALLAWLAERVAAAEEEAQVEDRARRLESDADAVQIMTIHRSKGLEFPIVLLPFAWGAPRIDKAVPVVHDEDGSRIVDVGGKDAPDFSDHQEDAESDQRWEDLRLLYVALTRAKHQVVVWWAPCAPNTSLAKLLFCRRPDGTVNTRGRPSSLFDDDTTRGILERIAGHAPPGRIAVEGIPEDIRPTSWSGRRTTAPALARARLRRPIDLEWRRTSYTGLTRDAHERHLVASEPEESVTDDEELVEAAGAVNTAPRDHPLAAVAGLFDGVAGGVQLGTFVHAVLEHVDFAAVDLAAALREEVARQQRRHQLEPGDAEVVADDLVRALSTPLGPLVGDRPLRAFRERDRLNELDFELPLAAVGGDPATVKAIAGLLRRHLDGTVLSGYAERLDIPAFDRALRGYLAGSIDLVLRVEDDAVGERFVVVDHKTNWLGARGEPLTAWHYRPAALDEAMQRSHYPLQALLYCVALHRYLRWRLPGYDPARHLGGAGYLFLRGMTGPDVPRVDGQPCGVFSWQIPSALVEDTSRLLAGGHGR